jgi:excisionase family DNA binding protein
MPTLEELPDWCTVAEVSRYLRLGRVTTYEMLRTGKIPHTRFGHQYRIPKASLVRLLSETSSEQPDLP